MITVIIGIVVVIAIVCAIAGIYNNMESTEILLIVSNQSLPPLPSSQMPLFSCRTSAHNFYSCLSLQKLFYSVTFSIL